MAGLMSHLSACARCGEKNMTVLTPSGASIAGSSGDMAGTVLSGLNTMGAIAVGLVLVPEPGKLTIFAIEPRAMG